MIIRTARNTGDFFVAKKTWAQDHDLSWEARGVLAYLFTHTGDWEIRMTDLVKNGPCKKYKLRSVMAELEDRGYVEREKVRRDDGTFTWVSRVFEEPSPTRSTMDDPPPRIASTMDETGDIRSNESLRNKPSTNVDGESEPSPPPSDDEEGSASPRSAAPAAQDTDRDEKKSLPSPSDTTNGPQAEADIERIRSTVDPARNEVNKYLTKLFSESFVPEGADVQPFRAYHGRLAKLRNHFDELRDDGAISLAQNMTYLRDEKGFALGGDAEWDEALADNVLNYLTGWAEKRLSDEGLKEQEPTEDGEYTKVQVDRFVEMGYDREDFYKFAVGYNDEEDKVYGYEKGWREQPQAA